ncbi:hypothetical protein ATE92_0911 [Ulvibacter sp. MAR_2010_11]|uniref:hypothetical protein n=1 Tax=Ulvibacter sp. MAR_2010_11 TaxID=1250229 RepID=UPI000C2B9824|nr:hypothetical protein [Ulvibacter sp. MAR_2010_11]PKA82774.1 hypothetical protein ATE92_0911 [Ulvibacter sp. MAR_2010_11]
MKKIFLLFALSLVLFSCKNSEEKNSEDTASEVLGPVQVYRGEFIYMADAAVLKGSDFIYGVKMDDMAAKLGEQVKPVKKEEFDMVEVTVKGALSPKPQGQEGWDHILTITEIIKVSNTPAQADVKIEEKKS